MAAGVGSDRGPGGSVTVTSAPLVSCASTSACWPVGGVERRGRRGERQRQRRAARRPGPAGGAWRLIIAAAVEDSAPADRTHRRPEPAAAGQDEVGQPPRQQPGTDPQQRGPGERPVGHRDGRHALGGEDERVAGAGWLPGPGAHP